MPWKAGKRKESKTLFEWGKGNTIEEKIKLLPGKDIKQIVCGGSHSVVLLENGSLFVWGDGRSGQLGLGNGVKKSDIPIKVKSIPDDIEKVWCGFAQTAVLTSTGLIFTWGFDPFLGPIFEPVEMKNDYDGLVKQIAFGPSTGMILMEGKKRLSIVSPVQHSQILVRGSCNKGCLGLGLEVFSTNDLTSIPLLQSRGVTSISVGEFHCAAVTSSSGIHIWGLNELETLGTFCGGFIPSPKPVLKLECSTILEVVCGTNCTYARCTKGFLYSWGIGRHGVLGHGDEENQQFPKKITTLSSIVGVVSGGMHAVAWTTEGDLYTWGCGRYFVLGHSDDKDRFIPTKIEEITRGKLVVQVSCGFDRTAVLLRANLITVTYKQEVKTFPIIATSTADDVVQQLTEHLGISSTAISLFDGNGRELPRNQNMISCTQESRTFYLIKRPNLWAEADPSSLVFVGDPPSEDKQQDTTPVLAKATIDKLIMWLTHHTSTGQDFSKVFLYMYPHFLTSAVLLEKLMDRYVSPHLPHFLHESMAKEARKIIQLRVVNVLRKWIQGAYLDMMQDSDVSLVNTMRHFIETDIQREQPQEAVFLRRCLGNQISTRERMSRVYKPTSTAPDTEAPTHRKEMDIFKFSSREMAKQLAIIEHSYFLKKIRPCEFIKLAWTKDNKAELAPNITASISRFNNLSQWCSAEILRATTCQGRVQVAELFIDLAYESLQLNNFNAVMAIVVAFRSAAIWRLRIWSKKNGISSKHVTLLHSMQELMSIDSNMENYREYYNTIPGPKVPFLGIILQDLVRLYVANQDRDHENPELINFTKWMKLGSIVDAFVGVQQLPYDLHPIYPLIKYLLSACGFHNHENASYQFSLLIEPEESKGQRNNVVLVIPSYLSDIIPCLYEEESKKPLLEEPEILLLNQKSKLVLRDFQDSLVADRLTLWKSLLDKLVASTSRSLIVSQSRSFVNLTSKIQFSPINRKTDVDCLGFREVLCKSQIIEYSIDSVLVVFPSESAVKYLRALLKSTLRAHVPRIKFLEVLEELSSLRLLPEYRQYLVSLFSCYKDSTIQSRQNRISSAGRALARLQRTIEFEKGEDEKKEEPLDPISTFKRDIDFKASSIRFLYTQHQLLFEIHNEYQSVLQRAQKEDLDEVINNLPSKNAAKRIRLKEMNLEAANTQHTSKLIELETNLKAEEENIAVYDEEEKRILAELDSLDRKLKRNSKSLLTYSFFSSLAEEKAILLHQEEEAKKEEMEEFVNKTVKSCVEGAEMLHDSIGTVFLGGLDTHTNFFRTQYLEISNAFSSFMEDQASVQMAMNEVLAETPTEGSYNPQEDFMITCNYREGLVDCLPFSCDIADNVSSELSTSSSHLLTSQQRCLVTIQSWTK